MIIFIIVYTDPWTHEGCTDFDGECCGQGDNKSIISAYAHKEQAEIWLKSKTVDEQKNYEIEEVEFK